jgi:hypothetical protein
MALILLMILLALPLTLWTALIERDVGRQRHEDSLALLQQIEDEMALDAQILRRTNPQDFTQVDSVHRLDWFERLISIFDRNVQYLYSADTSMAYHAAKVVARVIGTLVLLLIFRVLIERIGALLDRWFRYGLEADRVRYLAAATVPDPR